MCSSFIAIEPHNSEILPFLLYGYHHTIQLKDIVIPTLLPHSTISNFYQSDNQNFFGGGRNPTFLFFLRYVETMGQLQLILLFLLLQCYLLWIFVSIRRLLQLIVCIGVSTSTSKTSSLLFFFFAKPPLKSADYPNPSFQPIHPTLQKRIAFSCISPPP